MKRRLTGILVVLLTMGLSLPALAASLQVEPKRLALGQPALVRVCLQGSPQKVRAVFKGRISALAQGKDGCWYGAVGADLQDKQGKAVLRVKADGKQVAAAKLTIFRRDRGIRRLKVNPKYLKLSPEALARYKKDRAAVKKVIKSFTPENYWQEAFILPLNSKVVSLFGRRSFVNGVERSPHGGVDLRGATGTPVPAAADGVVALVRDTYFAGNMVLLDHGRGVITRYLHLSQALVKPGQKVKKGEIIGKVGATGRVTGPHLDFGVRLAGARVDPQEWIALSKKLNARLGE
ncbi:MAG: M23 family metallopeptidase [Desulfarculaceae bacterium]|nr:M23 family metallopeptidase [Desulfarculaceae bacterium]MCF8071774.1 M23 family metallopeptidase [Desulfarculaceae bacterium]MCF8101324.1 M23 family metallopeptidase [Desulfarculaceae bacterium]MCF8117283.1 M23 family metallopeptidase [Desulfarculaceae bacterium]